MHSTLDIFMDESGKDKNEICLIGAISIPKDYYHLSNIQNLNQELKSQQIRLHFTQYNKYDFGLYHKVFDNFLKIPNIIDINIISYKKSNFKKHPLLANQDEIQDMVYEKIPERVIYGLLRQQSQLKPLTADVYIEKSREYANRNLHKQVKKQINVHALYRFDDFKIIHSRLLEKNQQIGVEFTDLIIGIVRFIMLNDYYSKEKNDISSKTALNKLILIDSLLPQIEHLLLRINLFEISQQDHLTRINFNNYLRLFKSQLLKIKEKHPEYFYKQKADN